MSKPNCEVGICPRACITSNGDGALIEHQLQLLRISIPRQAEPRAGDLHFEGARVESPALTSSRIDLRLDTAPFECNLDAAGACLV